MPLPRLAPFRELYHWANGPIYETSPSTVEMVKYVCSLAMKDAIPKVLSGPFAEWF